MRKRGQKRNLFKAIGLLILMLIPVALIIALGAYLHHHPMAVLTPKGPIGHKERNLMDVAILLSAIVVIPVYIMTILIVFKYRENNPRYTKYSPDWDGSKLYESIWWGIPIVIIGILSIITWQSSHALDPYKPLASVHKTLHVQVVALDWKWLFIYPDQHIASVNQVALPVNTPVDFEITSDTVMNSFWIPSLGSQIYAMPGMATQLNLMADTAGTYAGSSANISGSGFAGMKFTAQAVSDAGFASWVKQAQSSSTALTASAYKSLAQPSQNNPARYYKQPNSGLFDDVIMQYMMPGMTVGVSH